MALKTGDLTHHSWWFQRQKNCSKALKISLSFPLQGHSSTDQKAKGAIHSLDSSCWDYGSFTQT